MRKNLNFFVLTSTFAILMILLCVFIMLKNNNFTKYGAMEILMYNRDFEEHQGFTLEEFLLTKSMIDYNLTGDEIQDKNLLNKFQVDVRNLVQSKDSITCIHVKFSSTSTYKDFVKVIEICEIENAKIYVPFENSIWVTNIARADFIKAHPSKFSSEK